MKPSKKLAFLAVVSLSAWTSSMLFYSFFIVPRLPGVLSVPFTWWILMALPVAATIIFAGSQAMSRSEVIPNSVATAIPMIFVETLVAMFAGSPIIHDTSVTDIQYWAEMALETGVVVIAVALVSLCFNTFRKWQYGV